MTEKPRPIICPWCMNIGPHAEWCSWDRSLAAATWRLGLAVADLREELLRLVVPIANLLEWLITEALAWRARRT